MIALRSARGRRRGFTIIEILVVVAIVGLMSAGAIYGFRAVAKSELRSSASKLAAAIRYCFDRAVTTGAYYRIVLDLDSSTYWAERSEERAWLSAGKERTAGAGRAYDADAEEKKRLEEERKVEALGRSAGGAAVTIDPPPKPKRAKFQRFKDATLPLVKLRRIQLFDIYTPRQPEPYTKGRAYLYFFPDGHTERALIRLTDGEAFYSLLTHPLTGRVEVKSEKVEFDRELGQRDEEGNQVAPR